MAKKHYPIKDGWIHFKMRLLIGRSLTQDQVLKFVVPADHEANQYEIAEFKITKTMAKLIVRRKSDNQ